MRWTPTARSSSPCISSRCSAFEGSRYSNCPTSSGCFLCEARHSPGCGTAGVLRLPPLLRAAAQRELRPHCRRRRPFATQLPKPDPRHMPLGSTHQSTPFLRPSQLPRTCIMLRPRHCGVHSAALCAFNRNNGRGQGRCSLPDAPMNTSTVHPSPGKFCPPRFPELAACPLCVSCPFQRPACSLSLAATRAPARRLHIARP